jgi:hypothetical protein
VDDFRVTFGVIVLAFALGMAGCDREESITTYTAPKEAKEQADSAVAGISWKLPAGWAAQKPHEFEKARFAVDADDASTSLSVSVLPPGMDLTQNINRWERQLALPPSSPEAAAQRVKPIEISGAPASSVELRGDDKSILGAIVARPDGTWFFKLMGPSEKVAAHASEYDAFMKSVRFDGATASAASPATAPSAKVATATTIPSVPTPLLPKSQPAPAVSDLPFTYNAPAEWKLESNSRPMRLFTYLAGPADKPAQVFVSTLTASGFDLDANLARWRRQIGLPPDADPGTTKISEIKIGGRDGKQVELTGPTQRLIVAFTGKQSILFFKIQGPAEVVSEQKPAFDTFLSSVKFKAE